MTTPVTRHCGPGIDAYGTARMGATFANTGHRDGVVVVVVVVQLYLCVSTTGVIRRLGGFTRVALAAGEQRRGRSVPFAVWPPSAL